MRDGPPKEARQFAKALRVNTTSAERRLWSLLRAGRVGGYKFKRQVPLEGYVADFVCFEARLIVEADGSQHFESQHDVIRDERFAEAGFLTLRFWNYEILGNPEEVTATIRKALGRRLGSRAD